MRQATNQWESDFLFYVWDETIRKVLEREPQTIRYLAAITRETLDEALRTWAIRCGQTIDQSGKTKNISELQTSSSSSPSTKSSYADLNETVSQ